MTDTSRKDTNSSDSRLVIGQTAFLYGLPEEHKLMNGIVVQIIEHSRTDARGMPCLPGESFYKCRIPRPLGYYLLVNEKYLAHLDLYDQDTISRYRNDPPKQLQHAK